jgi:competence protein ComEC
VVLVLHPEALGGPGFQMSFAATTALVVVFRAMRHVNTHRIPRWLRPVLSVFVSSLVAGLATAPFAAAHFNQISHYGLIANLLSVPLMGALVMPAAVLAVCLAPFGLMYIGLWPMELGLRWILYVAHEVAGLDGALSHVVAPGHLVLPLLTLGLLWLILWQGRLRVLGAGVAASAFAVWSVADRPALLIADNGALMGQMTAAGRALSRGTGNSFVAGIWLENDGAPVPQEDAAARPGFLREGRLTRTTIGGFDVLQVSGKTALADLVGCDGADIVVSNQLDAGARPCLVYDVRALRSSGAIAMNVNADGGLQITTVRAVAGIRPWNDYASVSADEQVTQLISE